MKILMFGRGVISTQYGWAFEKAGHTVEFYRRNAVSQTLEKCDCKWKGIIAIAKSPKC